MIGICLVTLIPNPTKCSDVFVSKARALYFLSFQACPSRQGITLQGFSVHVGSAILGVAVVLNGFDQNGIVMTDCELGTTQLRQLYFSLCQ